MLRLGLSVTFLSDIHMQQINLVNFCGKGDVIFAISHSGSSKLVVDATRLGKWQGATVITLTDISSSELKKEADIALCTTSDETRWNLHAPASKIAQYTIVDALYTAIAYKYRSETASYTKNVEASMTQFKY